MDDDKMTTIRDFIQNLEIEFNDDFDFSPDENMKNAQKIRAKILDAFESNDDDEILNMNVETNCGVAISNLIANASRIFAITFEYDVRDVIVRAIVRASNVIYFG